MLRSSFLVFLGGWIAWFLLDKPAGLQSGFPGSSDDVLGHFQYAFDMLKAGYPAMAFVFIWKQHYLLLSLLGGALLGVLSGVVGDWLGRRRMRRLVLPAGVQRKQQAAGAPEPASAPAPGDDSVGNQRVE